ncbi:MAG: hypothetical protein ACR2JS_05365 [Candidatus Nanopelagicales bacterium]
MNIITDQQIDGAAAKYLREKAGQSQRAFWRTFGMTQSCGCRYEGGAAIPDAIRTLIFMIHIAGLKIDASTEEGAASLIRLAKLQASEQAEEKAAIGEKLQTVLGHVKSAADVLQTV